MCQESARMDDESESRLSVCATGNEFLVDEYLARITNRMDEKSPGWKKSLEAKRISLEKIR